MTFFVRKRIISPVKMVLFVSDRVSCTILRIRWRDIIIFNLPSPRKDKTDDMNVSIFEKLDIVFDRLRKYHKNILFRNFTAQVRRKIFSNHQL
jgi:hypothetical protein